MLNRITHFFPALPAVLFLFSMVTVNADTLISPADSRINYYGRFDLSTPTAPLFAWPGSAVEANLPGPHIGLLLVDGRGDYDVEIDGVPDTVVVTDSSRTIMLGSSFSEGLHHVRITLRNEHHFNTASFRGFILADGREPGPAPDVPLRKIEFVGDSYTAGYGIESTDRTCNEQQLRTTTNVDKSFATLTTKAFHAQSTILAWSGAGLVRNYGEATQRGQTPYPSRYDRTLSSAAGTKWKYTRWTADLVVICLGTNDYSSEPVPDDSMFIGDYHAFIARVIGNYPDAAILCVGTSDSLLRRKVAAVVEEEQTALNHPQVFGAQFPDSLAFTGCDYHPSLSDNEAIAGVLVDTIMKRLGWDTTETGVNYNHRRAHAASSSSNFTITNNDNMLRIALRGPNIAAEKIQLVAPSGRTVRTLTTTSSGKCVVSMNNLSAGLYLVGNTRLGWRRVAAGK